MAKDPDTETRLRPSASEDGPIVEMHEVGKVYGTKIRTRALEDVSFAVTRGEFGAIIGPSGSGKSTLLNLIGALDRPSEGVVRIAGESLSEQDDDGLARIRNRNIGFVFQFHFLLGDFTALENVLMPYAIQRDVPTPEDRAEAESLLERVGLQDRMRNLATDLSGGQQQRVAIARALAGGRPLILADEPTGNLDTQTGQEVLDLMREINQTDGATFLIVTHDPDLAHQTDRILEVRDGRLVRDAPNP